MARTDYAPLGRSDGDYPSNYDRGSGRSRNREFEEEDRYGERFGNRDRGRRIAIDETSKLIASNKVEGTAVYDRDGDRMGSIYNFMVNKRSGRVDYAVLTFGGILGMGRDYYPLPWEMLRYDTRLGGYIVDMDEEDLDRAPRYRHGEEPRFDDSYTRYIYGYYGLPW
jgi:sporulation protein YlmC with PRC-barrel domain